MLFHNAFASQRTLLAIKKSVAKIGKITHKKNTKKI
jgi:hypothetical protein